MTLSLVCICFFHAWFVGWQQLDRKAKKGPLKGDGAAGGERQKVPARRLGPEAESKSRGAWGITAGLSIRPQA